jgi:cation transport ATPase
MHLRFLKVLQILAGLEKYSEHPPANAIVQGVKDRNVEAIEESDFELVTGMGVSGCIDGQSLVLDNLKLMEQQNISKAQSNIDNTFFAQADALRGTNSNLTCV